MNTYVADSGMIYPVADPQLILPRGMTTGYEGRDLDKHPCHGAGLPKGIEVIDPSEYQDRIREKDANGSWLADRADKLGSKVKNQANSSYCHVHAPVRGMEYWYLTSNGQIKTLSAFYAGAKIKGGRNVGGSGVEDAEWLMQNGTCLESMHAPMDFSTRNAPEVDANALLHKITLLLDLDPGDWKSIISAALQDLPTTVGIPAWGHEVLVGVKLKWDPANYSWNYNVAPIFDNSWNFDWGTNGRGVLSRAYCRLDEAMIIGGCTPAKN